MSQQIDFLFEGDVFEQNSVLLGGSLCLGNESLNFLFPSVAEEPSETRRTSFPCRKILGFRKLIFRLKSARAVCPQQSQGSPSPTTARGGQPLDVRTAARHRSGLPPPSRPSDGASTTTSSHPIFSVQFNFI